MKYLVSEARDNTDCNSSLQKCQKLTPNLSIATLVCQLIWSYPSGEYRDYVVVGVGNGGAAT